MGVCRFTVLLVLLVCAGGMCPLARGQEAESAGVVDESAAPLMDGEVARRDAAVDLEKQLSARRAMEMGFPEIAAGLWQGLVETSPAGEARDELILDWTMSLLEGQDVAGAAAALQRVGNSNTPRVRLRRALIEMARGHAGDAEAALGGLSADRLPASERSWFHYLIGSIADSNNNPQSAKAAYRAAIAVATSGLQRARFELADLRSTWQVSEPTEAQLGVLRRRMDDFVGEGPGYDSAKRYAAVLAALGRGSEAIAFLQNQLLALPAAERAQQDDFRLLLGLIAGASDGLGRVALERLLEEGSNRQKQRVALRMLADETTRPAQREQLRVTLVRLLAKAEQAGETHPIEQDLLLYRAKLAATSEEKTRDPLTLLERYPASDLRPIALGVLVSAAWEGQRYRAAAGYAAQARRVPSMDPQVRSQLAVMQAEAFFRAGDFRSAADAYGAALDELPTGVSAGDMIFQEVLSRIRDRQLTEAANRIDVLAADPRFDVVNRWQSEWKLARALQAEDRVAEAFARVNRVIAEANDQTVELPTDLSVRLHWLQARLALEAGRPEQTLEQAPALRARLASVSPTLRRETEASLRLLEAEAYFALDRQDEALAMLRALREEAPGTDAAVYSYIEEANVQASRGQLVEAQSLLTALVEANPRHAYAPFALYQSALMAEARREDSYLREAVVKIEKLVTTYPDDPLVFYARFKQGDLLRKLNQWEPARLVYEEIINKSPQHAEVRSAQLALADTLSAQAGLSDPSLRDSAGAIYERLRDYRLASVELRIEAGFKAGSVLEQNKALDRAAETWWQVANEFLITPLAAGQEIPELGVNGRYWMARLLAQLGGLLERRDRVAEARRAYALMRDTGLPHQAWAAAQLTRLGGAPAAESGSGG